MLPQYSDFPRFWSKVSIGAPDECWLWQAYKTPAGYGQFGRNTPAHRVAYELCVGPIPEGLDIDHLCRTHDCQNPRHLEAVTRRENVLRGVGPTARNARATQCPQGHSYTDENILIIKNGKRCRECDRQSNKEWWHRRGKILRRERHARAKQS